MDKAPETTSGNKANATWFPVFISIVVYPGVGQMMQKRKIIGAIYIILFTVMALMFTWILVKFMFEIFPILRDAFNGNMVEDRKPPSFMILLKPFAILMLIYAVNIIDVIYGRVRIRKTIAQSH